MWVPLIIAAPPAVYGASEHFENVKTFFVAHPNLKLLCVLWPLSLIPFSFLYTFIKSKVECGSISLKELNFLFNIIDHVVGKKSERFADALEEIQNKRNKPQANEIFNKITQPKIQIDELVSGIWQFFEGSKETIDKDTKIRVALAEMGIIHIEQFLCFYPSNEGPRSSEQSLKNDESCFSKAKKRRKMIIVNDIRAEAKKEKGKKCFIVTSAEFENEDGSLICYPVVIRKTKEVPYVISICASKKNFFKKNEKERYELILSRFSQRIALEYCLKTIKNKAKL